MAALTVTQLDHDTAVTLPASPGTAADTTNGDTVANGGYTLLVVNNTDAASQDVTIVTPGKVDALNVEDRVFTVPASTIQFIRLGPVAVYGSNVTVTCNSANVLLAAYAM
jgi:hypothetical protein